MFPPPPRTPLSPGARPWAATSGAEGALMKSSSAATSAKPEGSEVLTTW
jgi:hypothetical protein